MALDIDGLELMAELMELAREEKEKALFILEQPAVSEKMKLLAKMHTDRYRTYISAVQLVRKRREKNAKT